MKFYYCSDIDIKHLVESHIVPTFLLCILRNLFCAFLLITFIISIANEWNNGIWLLEYQNIAFLIMFIHSIFMSIITMIYFANGSYPKHYLVTDLLQVQYSFIQISQLVIPIIYWSFIFHMDNFVLQNSQLQFSQIAIHGFGFFYSFYLFIFGKLGMYPLDTLVVGMVTLLYVIFVWFIFIANDYWILTLLNVWNETAARDYSIFCLIYLFITFIVFLLHQIRIAYTSNRDDNHKYQILA